MFTHHVTTLEESIMMSRLATLACLSVLVLAGATRGGEASPNEAIIFDFEKGGNNHFDPVDKFEFVPEHATQGATSAKATLTASIAVSFGYYGDSNMKGRWGEFDNFVIDVFVEGGPVKIYALARDNAAKTWDTRYNNDFTLQPGKRNLSFALGALNRQNGRGNLDLAQLDSWGIVFESADAAQPATIYLDNARLVKGSGSFEVKTLFSFEGDDAGKVLLEDWPEEFKGKSAMTPVEEHATSGKKALKLESRAPAGNVQFSGFEADWSRYDTLAIDIFNPGDEPVHVNGWIRATDPKSPWHLRHNYERVLRPGQNVLKLPAGGLATPDGKPIDTTKIICFNLAVDNQTIYLDSVRLIKGVEEVPVEGLKKFDFGPANSAVMPGFTRVSKSTVYEKGAGFGWLPGAEYTRDFDIYEVLGRHRPPDDLCRDAAMPAHAKFAVDLPDGDYQVWMMQAPPGLGWGSTFKHRRVLAQGAVKFEQEFTPESFKKWEFQFEDAEDLPGDDLWERYISVYFKPVTFDVNVTGGQMVLEFDSFGVYGWATQLNGLVMWPKAQSAQAAKWLANLEAQRKEQYQALHVESLPKTPPPYAATADEKARGFVRFVHSPDRDIDVNSVPAPEEIKAAGIELSASPGEYQCGCIGLYPLKDCGIVNVSVSELSGGGNTIPAAATKLQIARYKALNRTATYTFAPKYLDDVSGKDVAIKANVTRSFWAVVHVPADAAAGTYSGAITLSFASGAKDTIPLTVNVWPIKLAEPEIPIGMFMMGPLNDYPQLGAPEEVWKGWKDVLEDAHEHGLTSVDPLVNIPLQKVANGKAEVDFAAMDRFMELAKAAGFKQEICGYGIGTGFAMRPGFDLIKEGKRFGLDDYGQLAKAYFDAVREHAKEKSWLRITFCTDDEYIVHPDGKPEVLAAMHKALQDNAPDFHFTTFDSCFYKQHPEQAESFDKMLTQIDTWGAAIHTPREAEVLKKANRRLWLYNTGMNRFTFGTYMFYAHQNYGVSGFFQWIYPSSGTYGHFYLASFNEAGYGVVYPSSHGLRSTPIWERVRAGCNDHRYLQTAWNLIAQAKAAGKGAAEAKALRDTIERTFAQLNFGNNKADAKAAAEGEGKADNPLTPAGMNALRKSVAEGIMSLQKALQ
jgi:hypothetical protein